MSSEILRGWVAKEAAEYRPLKNFKSTLRHEADSITSLCKMMNRLSASSKAQHSDASVHVLFKWLKDLKD